MPPEPIPWDRKDLFRERRHERSESLGSVARWRDSSSHHSSREFNRWGSADYRRPAGHGKQGGWHLLPEEPGRGYVLSRSYDKMLEEDNYRSVISRGDGKYSRSNRDRENRGSFSQRYWRGRSWEAANGSQNLSRRQLDANNDQRSADDMLTYSSRPHSDFVNTWEQHHLKDQHDKMGGVNGLGSGKRCDKESSLGSIGWKRLKWTRSGSLASRGSGFGHSSSLRGFGRADSSEGKAELHNKHAAAIGVHSGEASTCAISSAPSEETNSKKPRLNWGEGLAKYEKKKVDGPDVCANKYGPLLSTGNVEACNFVSPNLADKSPKVTGFSACVSPATPSSVACSSSPGVDDKFFGKPANADNDVNNLSGSPSPGSQNHMQKFSFSLEKLDIDSLTSLVSSLIELVQSDDPSSVDSSLLRSTELSKLLIWKADISKVLEVTESEIDLLENELKSLKYESGGKFLCPSKAGSLLACYNAKSCDGYVGDSDKVAHPEPLHTVSPVDCNVEKIALSSNLHSIHDDFKEENIDSPGTATSKFVEPLPLTNPVSLCEAVTNYTCSGDLDVIQSTALKCLVPCTCMQVASASVCGDGSTYMEVKDAMDADSGVSFCSVTDDILYNAIISSNKESANRAYDVFAKLLPKECGNIGASGGSCSQTSALVMEKFAEKKRFARFKERVIALRFKALHRLWKKDMRLLSIRKCRPKSYKKHELGIRTSCSSHQKSRSFLRSRFSFPAGNHLSLVPTSEIINFASKLLSESQVKIHSNRLRMPALILDQKEKMISKFISSNGLVEDPLAIEKERAMINPWTSEEREIFLEKFASFGKDFRKIASFLDHKTTADCVEFYYKNHKSDCFEKIKKQDGVKLGKSFSAKTNLMVSANKWNCEVNAASLEILNAASVMVDGIEGSQNMRSGSFLLRGYGKMKMSRREGNALQRSSSFDVLRDERETVAADVLAGICGSLSYESMSSGMTSLVDPVKGNMRRKCLKVSHLDKQPVMPDVTQIIEDGTCSDDSCGEMDPTDWTDEEKASFLLAVSSSGKDFATIAQLVGTRSQEQCKVFFSKARKCLGLDLMPPRPENLGSPGNDNANDGGSDTDDARVIETGSVIGSDKSGTKTDEDLHSSVRNAYHDESNPVEARNLSTDLNESKELSGTEVDHEDVNMVSDAFVNKGELGIDVTGVVLYSSDTSGSNRSKKDTIMSDNTEAEKDQRNEVGNAVSELVLTKGIIELCQSNSVVEVSSGGHGNELEGQRSSSPRLSDRYDKHEADTGVVVEFKNSVHDSSETVNTSSVGISCSRLSFDAENQPRVSGMPVEDPHATKISLSQNAVAVVFEKTASQDQLSSTCDFQGKLDMHCHNSISNGDPQLYDPADLLDHLEASGIHQGYPLEVPVKKEENVDTSCSSSSNELLLMSQKIEQTQSQLSSDSEKSSRSGDVKLFGKILTNPTSTQKLNLTTKGNEKNDIHHTMLSSDTPSLKFTDHPNADGSLAILKVDCNDHSDHWSLENVPIQSYGNGNRIQTGFSSLPDSAMLLAKYPDAFSNYPASSAKSDQELLHPVAKNNDHHLSGASASATREVDDDNGVIDYQNL